MINTVTQSYLFLFIFNLVFFKPMYFQDKFPVNVMLYLMEVFAWIIIGFIQIKKIHKVKPYIFFWDLFWIINIIIIIVNWNSESFFALEKTLSFLFIINYFDIIFSSGSKKGIQALWIYIFLGQIIELVTIPFYKLDIISITWYGIKTRSTDSAIPFILLSILCKKQIGLKLYCISIIAAILNIVLLENDTGIIALILIMGLIMFIKLYPKCIITNRYMVTLLPIAFSTSIVFFGIQKYFSIIIDLLFNKTITLSGRTEFWADAINKLMSPIIVKRLFGVGFYNDSQWVFWERIDSFVESHNLLLQLLHDCGVIGTGMFFIGIFYMVSLCDKYLNKRINNIMMIFCLVYLLICVTEIYAYYPYFYLLFCLAANIENIGRIISNSKALSFLKFTK